MNVKNLQLLGVEKSPAWQPSIQEIITSLQTELAIGEAVYSPAEMEQLARKLEEYEFMLQRIISN